MRTVSTRPAALTALMSVGKVAPPMPTMPASRMMVSRSSGERPSRVSWGTRVRSGVSRPSFSSTADSTGRPKGWGRGSTARTRPETEACTVALRPSASPIFWPRRTVSPGFTRGVQGLPICWSMGITTWAGSGAGDRGAPRESSLRPSGWTPPQNRCLMDSPLCQDQILPMGEN